MLHTFKFVTPILLSNEHDQPLLASEHLNKGNRRRMSRKIQDLAESVASTPQAAKELPGKIRAYIKLHTGNDPLKFAALDDGQITALAKCMIQEQCQNSEYDWSHLCLRRTLNADEMKQLQSKISAIEQIIKNQVVNRRRNNTKPKANARRMGRSPKTRPASSNLPGLPQLTESDGSASEADTFQYLDIDSDTERYRGFPMGFSRDIPDASRFLREEIVGNAVPDRSYVDAQHDCTQGFKRKRSDSEENATRSRCSSLSGIEVLESRQVHESITALSSRTPVTSMATQTEQAQIEPQVEAASESSVTQKRGIVVNLLFDYPPIMPKSDAEQKQLCVRCNVVNDDASTQTTPVQVMGPAIQRDKSPQRDGSVDNKYLNISAEPDGESANDDNKDDDDSDAEDPHFFDFAKAERLLMIWRAEELEIAHKRKVADKATRIALKRRQKELGDGIEVMDALVHLKTIRPANEPKMAWHST